MCAYIEFEMMARIYAAGMLTVGLPGVLVFAYWVCRRG